MPVRLWQTAGPVRIAIVIAACILTFDVALLVRGILTGDAPLILDRAFGLEPGRLFAQEFSAWRIGLVAASLPVISWIDWQWARLATTIRDTSAPDWVASGRFGLYLRPFGSDFVGGSGIIQRVGVAGAEMELGDELRRTTRPVGMLVAPGLRKDALAGPAFLRVPDDWLPAVVSLMARAKVIYVMPWTSDGSRREIGELLAHRHVAKTVFVMPTYTPELAQAVAKHYGITTGAEFAVHWTAAWAPLVAAGVPVTPYDPTGGLWVQTGHGMERVNHHGLRRYLRHLAADAKVDFAAVP